MTPDKIWINWTPADDEHFPTAVGAATVLSHINTMAYPVEYTRTSTLEPIAPPDVAQAARVADRIQGNAGELADEYGPIDEICASGCDVHLEQMGTDCFWLGLTRGTEELHIKIFKRGKSIHAEITHQEGFGLRAIAEGGDNA